MKKPFFIYVIICALFVPIAHAMEQTNLITSDGFNEDGKEYMRHTIAMWYETARMINVTKGLARLFNDFHGAGVDAIINDQKALERANKVYSVMDERTINNPFAFCDMSLVSRVDVLTLWKRIEEAHIDSNVLLQNIGYPVHTSAQQELLKDKSLSDEALQAYEKLQEYIAEQTIQAKAMLLIAGHIVQNKKEV